MKAVVLRDIGDILLENVREPKIENGFDAIVRLTSSAICGTDLHFVRGTVPGMVPGTVRGHDSSRQAKEPLTFPHFSNANQPKYQLCLMFLS